MIEVLQSGPANSVQDAGRHGLLHLGISRGGAMDRLSHDLANAMLGNPADAATIEVASYPLRIRFQTGGSIALAGADCAAELDGGVLPPFWASPVRKGTILRLGPPRKGMRAYLALAGGVAVDPVMGSRSTDLKAGFGGLAGRALAAGDIVGAGGGGAELPPGGAGMAADSDILGFWRTDTSRAEVAVIPAAEYGEFSPAACRLFFDQPWTVSRDANRQGYRLDGPRLDRPAGRELLSHGLLPGVVQVPAGGQPIVQLADANTCGGYPKLAVVIGPDLWKFAQLKPGAELRFVQTTVSQALAAHQAQKALIASVRRRCQVISNTGRA